MYPFTVSSNTSPSNHVYTLCTASVVPYFIVTVLADLAQIPKCSVSVSKETRQSD